MAQNDWILDVLTDLRSFAGANGLQRLAAELDQTLTVAALDIARDRSEGPRADRAEDLPPDHPTGPAFAGKSL